MKYTIKIFLYICIGIVAIFFLFTTRVDVDVFVISDIEKEKEAWLADERSGKQYIYKDIFFMPMSQIATNDSQKIFLFMYSKKKNQKIYIKSVNIGTISLGVSGEYYIDKYDKGVYHIKLPNTGGIIIPNKMLESEKNGSSIVMTVVVGDETTVKKLKFSFQHTIEKELFLVD